MENLGIRFIGKGELALEKGPIPEPGPGQILVETSKSLISTGTECICYNRWFEPGTHWDRWVTYPFSPGYSNAGVVRAVGADVRDFKVGDRVAARKPHTRFWLADGSVGDRSGLPIPEGVSDEAATWFGLGLITQNGVRAAGHVLGDDVLIVGCGVLGQLVTQYARLMGARTVVVVDTADMRLEAAKAHGATHCIAQPVESCAEAVAKATDGRMPSIVYDITGHASVLAKALPLVRDFGTLVVLGDTGTPSGQTLTGDVIRRGVRIVGAHDGHAPVETTRRESWNRVNICRLFFDYVRRGDMRVDDLVTHRFSPLEAKQVYDQLTTDRSQVLGVVFDWTQLGS